MKMVSMNCPHCNAPLRVNPNLEQAFCNYCGYHLLIDHEIRKVQISEEDYEPIGKAMNDARIKTDRQATDEALKKVGMIRDSYRKRAELGREMSFQQSRLQQDERQIQSIGNWIKFWNFFPDPINLLIIPAAIFALFIILAVVAWFLAGGMILTGIILSALSFFLFRLLRTRQFSEYRRLVDEANSLRSAISRNSEEIYRINSETDFSFVPNKYHTEEALNYFYDVLCNKRAVNLTQAINLFEEEMYRNRMERMQSEQLRIQKEQMEEMRRQQEEKTKDHDGTNIISTVGKVAAAGLIFKMGHDFLKGFKDNFL